MAKFAAAVILVSFVAVAMAGGYKEKSYESAPYMKPYGSSYVPQKKHYDTPTYDMKPKYEASYGPEKKHYEAPSYHVPAYNVKAYSPPQPSYQMKAKAYIPQPSYVENKGYDNKYEKPKSYGSYSGAH